MSVNVSAASAPGNDSPLNPGGPEMKAYPVPAKTIQPAGEPLLSLCVSSLLVSEAKEAESPLENRPDPGEIGKASESSRSLE